MKRKKKSKNREWKEETSGGGKYNKEVFMIKEWIYQEGR